MPRSSAKLIKNLGYDIEDVRDIGLRKAKDEEIVEYALKRKGVDIVSVVEFSPANKIHGATVMRHINIILRYKNPYIRLASFVV